MATIEIYKDGVLLGSEDRPDDLGDENRKQVMASYAVATQATLDNTNVPLVLKAWVRALNRVLRLLIREVQE